MILIADSGSTKTDWVLIDKEGQTRRYETVGFNPYFVPADEMSEILDKFLVPFIDNRGIRELFYYGSGCSTKNKCFIVEEALEKVFPQARLEVEHDLLGAARGLLGMEKGIACILGTGSNSCLYDGHEIIENVPSLGYLFGDEGSGAHIGKIFISDYLHGKLPKIISLAFDKQYNLSLENILDAVYNQPWPNRFLGSFMEFIAGYKDNKYIQGLVHSSFRKFFGEQVTKYSDYDKLPVSFVGSVAYHFKDIIKDVAAHYHIKLNAVKKDPIRGLVKYHYSPDDQT
jgi:N-acetylglucosamine kinase-like BadF-type ATPase